jgi:hypothetical protein
VRPEAGMPAKGTEGDQLTAAGVTDRRSKKIGCRSQRVEATGRWEPEVPSVHREVSQVAHRTGPIPGTVSSSSTEPTTLVRSPVVEDLLVRAAQPSGLAVLSTGSSTHSARRRSSSLADEAVNVRSETEPRRYVRCRSQLQSPPLGEDSPFRADTERCRLYFGS